ncbi:MAG: hypothetical protein LBT67_00355 [Holosporaceae bacterium]|jgi:trk system potassium uptake protein TrkH|nr:hypothetical protein [Holosporaceae bacterium]
MISWRNISCALGVLLFALSGLMLIPAMVDVFQGSDTYAYFIISGVFCCFLGGIFYFSCRPEGNIDFSPRDCVLALLFSWFSIPPLAALPFLLSPFQLSPANCLFEATSLFTTTGATVICDVKNFSDGFLLWRSLLQMFGGIFFMISCVYVFPRIKSIHVFSPERLVSGNNMDMGMCQLKEILAIYLSLSFIASLLFISQGTPALDSLCYSFSALSTGGAIPDDGCAENLREMIWLLPILMFIGGCPMSLAANLFTRKSNIRDNSQFRYYSISLLVLIVLLCLYAFFLLPHHSAILEIFGKIFFLTISSVTTTGIGLDASGDFDQFLTAALYVLGFVGGCYGSCSGGIKIFRFIIVFRLIRSYFVRATRRNAVCVSAYAGDRLTEIDATELISYFSCYAILALLFSLLLVADGMNFGDAVGAVMTSMNNNGPFLGLQRATPSEIAAFTATSKAIFALSMIAGRVGFILFIMVVTKSFWRK